MTSAYQDLCDYLAIDAKKCPLNEFFTDLKSFCTVFINCLQENRLWHEQEEKNKRTQINKQLVEDLRRKQRAESKVEPKPFFKPSKFILEHCFASLIEYLSLIDDEDTDVVSNLMSVLKDANVSAQPRRIRRAAPGKFIRNSSPQFSLLPLSVMHTFFDHPHPFRCCRIRWSHIRTEYSSKTSISST